jgi:plastocyanin
MTFRSLICFSLLASNLPVAFPAALPAGVTGSVELSGQRNAGRKKKDFSGVVVWLDAVDPRSAPAATPRRAEILQKDKKFTPHVLVVAVGSQVDFPNRDPIFHNAFSSFSGMPFDVGLYPPGTSKSVVFTRAGIVRVFCNIHQTMSAVIVVLKTPWFGVTDAQGKFHIAGVPPGDYRLHVFYERTTQEQLKSLEKKVTVESEAWELPRLEISEAGYTPAPHKNKYGEDYPPVPDDRNYYPGARK